MMPVLDKEKLTALNATIERERKRKVFSAAGGYPKMSSRLSLSKLIEIDKGLKTEDALRTQECRRDVRI